MSAIADNIKYFHSTLPPQVRLIAISKTKSKEEILDAYNAGQRIFGENKVQELLPKYEELPKDIEWHFIGHLQTNKVRNIASFINFIHSVDSYKLLAEINSEAKKHNRIIPCLLEMFIAKEETKYGLDLDEAKAILENPDFFELKNIRIAGLMGMATYTDDMEHVRKEYRYLSEIFLAVKQQYFSSYPEFKELSMGMSGDYPVAIENGSTMIRVGSLIFGERIY